MAEHKSEYTGLLGWVDARMPTAMSEFKKHMSEYYAPKNFNFWYIFGGLAIVVLIIQILSGIFLTMHYNPDANLAFASVEYIMRDVPGGWFIRYMHSTGASFFFIVIYMHMFRALLYGSYRRPRELIWIFGCLLFLMLMAEAFFGYLLPWGQMSYWGAQVIVNLFGAIPFIGPELALFIRGDYVVGDATLNRFFAFHVIAIPLVLLGLVVAHNLALHDMGSNNPDGVEIKATKNDKTGMPLDGIPFHPYYTVHDIFVATIFLYILTANLVGLIPGFQGATRSANVTWAWALISFAVHQYVGIKEHGFGYVKHFLGPSMFDLKLGGRTYHMRLLAPLMIVIELVSHLSRVFTLAVRLLANMSADHIVVGIWIGLVPLVIPAVFMGLGVFVAFLQAYVFTMLSMIYIGLALEEAH